MGIVKWLVSVVVAMAILAVNPVQAQVGLAEESFEFNEADPIVGHWLGQAYLNRGPSAVSMLVERELDGSHSLVISIPRVSVYKQPCRNVMYRDGVLTARLPDVRGGQNAAAIQYLIQMRAEISKDNQSVEGVITFQPLSSSAPDTDDADIELHRTPRPLDLDTARSFSGFADPDETRFPLTFVVAETPGGNFVGHMDVPLNGLFGLFTYDNILDDDLLHLITSDRLPIVVDAFEEEDGEWIGTFRREKERTLVLKQDPYVSHELEYRNSRGQRMAAGLFVPDAPGPYPCAVIVSTFGPHDRDGLTLTHKHLAYLRMADYLTRQGYAVLRIDERGMKRSEGDFNGSTTADMARDINLAIAELKRVPTIDQDRIGIIGHGEGGVVGALVNAIDHHKIAFLAMMGAPIDFGKATLLFQAGQAMDFEDEHKEVKRANLQILSGILDAMRNDEEEPAIRAALRSELEKHRKALAPERVAQLPPLDEEVSQRLDPYTDDWTRYWVKLNVPGMFQQVHCPVYGAFGSLDKEVDPATNATLLERLASEKGMNVRVRRYEGLNHLFMEAPTGQKSEYLGLDGPPFADAVLRDLVEWLDLVTRD